jgi:hypothetical protein
MSYREDYIGLIQERFEHLFENKRLLAMKLDGFSHTIAFDNGYEDDPVIVKTYTAYAPEIKQDKRIKILFNGIPHGRFQGNPFVFHWVRPDER